MKLSRGCSEASMEMRSVGVWFSAEGIEGMVVMKRDEQRRDIQGLLSPDLKIFISYVCSAFLTKINTRTKHIFYVF